MRAFQLTVAEAQVLLDQLDVARPGAVTRPVEPFTDDPILDGAPPTPDDPASVVPPPPPTSATTLTRAVAPPGMARVDFLGPITVTVGHSDRTSAFQYSLRARADISKDTEEQIGLYEAAVGLYRGSLAFSVSTEWLLPHRVDRQRDYADAATRLALLYGATDAERTLAMLDAVLKRDPLNEDLYRRIMRRVQAKLQRLDAVNRTLQLLEARCEEIQSAPETSTYELAKALTRSKAA